MSLATLTHGSSSSAVTSCRVQVPAWGRWWADVEAQSPIAIDEGGSVVLTLAGVPMTGSVVAGREANGRAAYRIVSGSGGWSSDVSPRSYHDGGGVAVATILTDVAAVVGEELGSSLPPTRVGEHYAVSGGPASRVLHDLALRAWYVDFGGVTQIGARSSYTYDGTATRLDPKPIEGVVTLLAEDIAGLVPGVEVDGRPPATDVEYSLTPDRLTVRVYSGPRSSRDLDAMRRVFDAIDPRRAYRAAYEYRVVTQSGDALNLQPVRSSAGMPDLERVPARLPPGVRATFLPGSLVTVMFLDGDPSRPRVFTGDDDGAPGWMPLTLELGDTPTLGVARITDTVIAGPWPGTITSASARIKAGV